MMRLRPFVSAAVLLGFSSCSMGCALTTGILALGRARLSSSTQETITPLGARERQAEVTTEIEPLRVRCAVRERSARERVTIESWGLDGASRFFYGFVGLGEAGTASVLWYALSSVDDPSVGLGIAASLVTLDAIATMIMTFALPNHHTVESAEREGRWRVTTTCPDNLQIVYGGRALPVAPSGMLQADDEQWLVSQWVSLGGAAEMRVGSRVQSLAPTAEHRCLWARARGMAEAAMVCPRPSLAPQVVVASTRAPAPTLGVRPLQITIDLGVTVP